MCCAVAATAYGEPNFVSFLHENKGIVRIADVFLVLSLFSWTMHMISVFKKMVLQMY